MAVTTEEWIEGSEHLRARALRAHQGARGDVRRERGGPGRRRGCAGAGAGADGGAAAEEEEQTAFTVSLDAAGDKKIQVIKVVRSVTGLGLKEAKELVDNAPSKIKEGVAKEEADQVKSQLEEAGGVVSLS